MARGGSASPPTTTDVEAPPEFLMRPLLRSDPFEVFMATALEATHGAAELWCVAQACALLVVAREITVIAIEEREYASMMQEAALASDDDVKAPPRGEELERAETAPVVRGGGGRVSLCLARERGTGASVGARVCL